MKKLLSVLLAALLVSSMILSLAVGVSAESLYIRKIVSVVYDDSGSMLGDKWAYANYAMQAFCGMLNSEDQLFITYMHDAQSTWGTYDPQQIDLSAGGIQSSVDSIRNHTDNGSTPYSAVEIAYNKLKSVQDTNPNTQYWLVVITDGEFDEFGGMTYNEAKNTLNDNFRDYTKTVMPNGTHPQVTFLGIGDIPVPDYDAASGIYTYSASNANSIIDAMSDMADRVSGRTRLKDGDIKQLDDKTIQISSSIPLLNIAVLAQKSQAKITKAVYSDERSIPISRNISLGYPRYADLVGSAYLIGDSQTPIGAGTYKITFDQPINLKDVVILFEPALEMRMTVTVGGKQITDYSELDNTMEGDEISVSCKIYEMGTDNEISPNLLPPGTEFEISIAENGTVVKNAVGEQMHLPSYTLKNVDTELTASVTINGFNPISYTTKFTPLEYVPRIVYTIEPSFGGNVKSVKLDDIGTNKDLTVCFTVLADGVPLTDAAAVKALNPVISLSPDGNDGMISYSADGKIVFTPNAGREPSGDMGSYDVDVTCTIDDGTTAKLTYTVLLADYQVIPTDATQAVKKTELYGNQVGVSFYITKDGVKLDKAAVEKHISVLLGGDYAAYPHSIAVSPDGTITVIPYTEEEHSLNFWSWWGNWAYYWGLPDEDIAVTLDHAYGAADATIHIVDEDLKYQILNVWLPFLIELAAFATFVTWVVLVLTKPKYGKGALLYVGEIKYNKESGTHTVRNFSAVTLKKFNQIKRGNGRLKFKAKADVVSASGVKIRADRSNRIICEMTFPWFKGKLEPVDTDIRLRTPADVAAYIDKNKRLEVAEFTTGTKISGEYDRVMTAANPAMVKYIVIPDADNGISKVDDRRVIKSGTIFVYI
ncbi:MAG: VWA domain-containing protein [Ruminococcaceae bacterium]|nr:VWA domain-containing protein [Oscillospiraceae bacterium]